MTFPRMLGLWFAGLLAGTLGGCASDSTLIVELRTDMRPGVEFERVETALYAGSGIGALDLPTQVAMPVTLMASTDAFSGTRVAELPDVPVGPHLVRVQLLDGRRAVVGTGLASVVVEGANQIVTVLVNRACRGVECPGSGRPNEIACLGGRCVDPACPEDPSACPPPDCAVDADCPDVSCVTGRCLEGFCVRLPEDALCSTGVCRLEEGCVGVEAQDAGVVDAGAMDAGGVDAGVVDAGVVDAGATDAGPVDAGPVDAGPEVMGMVDGGLDAGPPDASLGPPCFELRTSGVNISLPGIGSGLPTWMATSPVTCASGSLSTPHYFDFVMCNAAATPRSFEVTILAHASGMTVNNASIWGYRGTEVPSDLTGCDFAITGVGSTAPSVTLNPGEYFVLRTGGTETGATGDFAMNIRP